MKIHKNKLILTSYGLTTPVGRKLIRKELANDNLENKKYFCSMKLIIILSPC